MTLTSEGVVTFANKADHLTPVSTAQLFNRFFTVETISVSSPNTRIGTADQSLSHELDGSTGLGLSIAKLLTERMGGTIDAEYKNGELYITVQFP